MNDDDDAARLDSPEAAIARLAARLGHAAATLGTEPAPLASARGRVLAEPVRADRDSPPFDHSAMDGYAVRLSDLAEGRTLPVLGESRPGRPAPTMPPARGCLRIATGAPRPDGAEAVVKREDVFEHLDEATGEVGRIAIAPGIAPRFGDHWRLRGENARAGDVLIDAGAAIDAAVAATMAACGIAMPLVRRRVRLAILTTGDEVVPIGERPRAEQIRNSNGPALAMLFATRPWIEVARVEHLPDEFDRLAARLAESIAGHDAVVLTGGVSMGHRDLVRAAIESQRAEILFHRLPQRPGRPMLGAIAGEDARPVPLFGLPGNPLSALTTARRIVLPTLAAIAGLRPTPPREVTVRAEDEFAPATLWRFQLARLDADGSAQLLPFRSSGDLAAAGRSEGFVEFQPHARLESGRRYAFFAWEG